jgi:hypothetical protein
MQSPDLPNPSKAGLAIDSLAALHSCVVHLAVSMCLKDRECHPLASSKLEPSLKIGVKMELIFLHIAGIRALLDLRLQKANKGRLMNSTSA